MQEKDLYLVSEMRASALCLLEPCVEYVPAPAREAAEPEPPPEAAEPRKVDLGAPDASDAASMLALSCAEVYASWFSVMRGAIRRERARQQAYREANGLPKSAKVPYEVPALTAIDVAVAAMAESTIRGMFGDVPADYARDKFRSAIDTGDMRAFKIRLLLLKVRDSLPEGQMREVFLQNLDPCISRAEQLAGCVPDPSPRRLSKKEQERKRRKELAAANKDDRQGMLPLEWPDDKKTVQDIEHKGADHTQEGPIQHIENGVYVENEKSTEINAAGISLESNGGQKEQEHSVTVSSVTVTGDNSGSSYANVTVTTRKRKPGKRRTNVIRKARDYNTVDEILDDIDSGKIVPYASTSEICKDIEDGVISAVDGLMFTAALEKYMPSAGEVASSDGADEGDEDTKGIVEDDEDDDLDEGNLEDGDEDDDFEDVQEDRRHGSQFSYNPRGFCGSEGLEVDDDE